MATENSVDNEMDLGDHNPIPEFNSDEENELLATTQMVLSSSPLDLSSSRTERDLSNFKIPKRSIPKTNELLADILQEAPPRYQSPLLKLELQPVIPKISYGAMAIPNSDNSYQLHIPEMNSLMQNPMMIPDKNIFTGKPLTPREHAVLYKPKNAHNLAKGRGAKKVWSPHDSVSKKIHSQVRAQVKRQLRGNPRANQYVNPLNDPPIYYHLEKLVQQLRRQANPRGARGAPRGQRW